MKYETIKFEILEHVACITLNREEVAIHGLIRKWPKN